MTRRFREIVEVRLGLPEHDRGQPQHPVSFRWRGTAYRVLGVLGHWREDAGYWVGGGLHVPQRDLWRVEARNGRAGTGVYELVCEDGLWRLDRVWD